MRDSRRYNVEMRLSKPTGNTPVGTWIILSDSGHTSWCLAIAREKYNGVKRSAIFAEWYDDFRITED